MILQTNHSIERRSKQMQKLGKPNTGYQRPRRHHKSRRYHHSGLKLNHQKMRHYRLRRRLKYLKLVFRQRLMSLDQIRLLRLRPRLH